jgi:hypothetical protein
MRLTDFIAQNHEKILEEWVRFAGTLMPWAKGMNETELRDHASELLDAVVLDMQAPQTRAEQSDKSQGLADGGALARIGQQHASERLAMGFNLDQLVSEYRALRASILRLWADSQGDQHKDITRFNEAIDESLTEATIRYSQLLDHTREQFIGILGHDLRTPLSAIIMGSTLLAASTTADARDTKIAARILNSGTRMNRMIADLLDLTRTRLGDGIPVTRVASDLALVCAQVLAELEIVHPECPLLFRPTGTLYGDWDADRLNQLLSNLISNALQHGKSECPVTLTADGTHEAYVTLTVHNEGESIPAKLLGTIFDPMVRRPTAGGDRNVTGLGLGLYIAREVVLAHGGNIAVTSDDTNGTKFVVELPRRAVRRGAPKPP